MVAYRPARRSCSGRISCRVEIELNAGRSSTCGLAPVESVPTQTPCPCQFHCNVRVSMAFKDSFGAALSNAGFLAPSIALGSAQTGVAHGEAPDDQSADHIWQLCETTGLAPGADLGPSRAPT